MRTSRPILVAAIALAGTGLAATPASACVFLAPACLGNSFECNPTESERLAEEKRWSAEATRQWLAEARKRLRSGQVDFAAELAELLVPNVRPVYIQTTSCGVIGELDYGAGREGEEEKFAALTAGTPLAGADLDRFRTPLRRAEEDISFGASCNAEFRRSFAGHLRQSLSPAHLREAWLFLGARQRSSGNYGSLYHRLISFEDRARTPPIRWTFADLWLRQQVERALRLTAWGRALVPAIDAFWARRAGDLADSSRVCPAELERWTAMRERLLPKLIEWDSMQRLPARKE
ncbi:MAG TPA: hypothetical protein VD846_02775 [Allosphingosinicella sp.]|nr:hypothetical protein [Allosphingosinicella sp.]